ncbi:hypothetical protein ACTFIU_004140 [Dictyostelium citrinum]
MKYYVSHWSSILLCRVIKPQYPDFTSFFKCEQIEDSHSIIEPPALRGISLSKDNAFSNSNYKFTSNITPIKTSGTISSPSSTFSSSFTPSSRISFASTTQNFVKNNQSYNDYQDNQEDDNEQYDEDEEYFEEPINPIPSLNKQQQQQQQQQK